MQSTREGPKRQVRSVFKGATPMPRHHKPKNRAERRKQKLMTGQKVEPWNLH